MLLQTMLPQMVFLLATTVLALASADEKPQQNFSDFDIIDSNVDGLISYGEFQRWHQVVMGAPAKNSAALFGTHDLDRDGKLTVAEFVPLAFELSRKPEKEAEKVFQKFDTNSDGFLSADELSGQEVSPDIVAGLLQIADLDGDERISRSEFGKVADSFESHITQDAKDLGQAQSLMAALDTDGDGQIGLEELSAYGRRYGGIGERDKLAAETAIAELDRNRDGKISLEELKRIPELVMRAAGIRPIVPA